MNISVNSLKCKIVYVGDEETDEECETKSPACMTRTDKTSKYTFIKFYIHLLLHPNQYLLIIY